MEISKQTKERVRGAETEQKTDSREPIFKASWVALAEKMSDYFKKNCFWLFWEYPEWRIRKKFDKIRDIQRTDFEYYLKMLKTVEEAEEEQKKAAERKERLFWVKRPGLNK